jgi:hypothetical protein
MRPHSPHWRDSFPILAILRLFLGELRVAPSMRLDPHHPDCRPMHTSAYSRLARVPSESGVNESVAKVEQTFAGLRVGLTPGRSLDTGLGVAAI